MEAVATIRPALSNLTLPVIDGQVPVCLVHENRNTSLYRELLCERLRAQLPVLLPDPSMDATLEDNLLRNMRALLQSRTERSGWPQWVFSDAHISVHLAAFDGPISTESGHELGNNLQMEIGGNVVCLGRELQALDAVDPGLGASVLDALKPDFTESVTTEVDVIHQLVEYQSEESMPNLLSCDQQKLQELDEVVEEALLNNGYEEEFIADHLPSALVRAAQLDGLKPPSDNLKHPQLIEHLQRAGVTNPHRLAQLLTEDLPRWSQVLHGLHALTNSGGDDWECHTSYYVGDRVLLSARTEDVRFIGGAIGAHLDDEYNAAMQDSDPNCVLLVDRVRKRFQAIEETNLCGFHTSAARDNPMVDRERDSGDGLLLVAAMTAAFSAIDEAIRWLQTIEHKETT